MPSSFDFFLRRITRVKKAAIYLDLDGVLADYEGGFRRDHPDFEFDPSLNRSSHLLPGSGSARKRAAYELIKGTDFYANLPLMAGAEELYVEVMKYDPEPTILTAAPKFGATEDDFHVNPYWLGAAFHKRNWVETVFIESVYHDLWAAEQIGNYCPEIPPSIRDPWFARNECEPCWSDLWIRASRNGRVRLPDERFICTTSSRKWQFMHRKHSDHQILIDDRSDNIEAWEKAGGVGIQHETAEKSILRLREILENA